MSYEKGIYYSYPYTNINKPHSSNEGVYREGLEQKAERSLHITAVHC